MTKKIAILSIAFFNTSILKRSLTSLVNAKNASNFDCKLFVLENESPHSPDIATFTKHLYDQQAITAHFLSKQNVAANIIIHAIEQNIINLEYDYIAVTESDVILDEGSLDEAIKIIEENPPLHLCSIDLHLHNLPLDAHPDAIHWVPPPIDQGTYLLGPTGFQFILFEKEFFQQFLHALREKKLHQPIALLNEPYESISDSNLAKFCELMNVSWPRTKYRKLLHIGWKLYTDPTNDYVQYKNNLVDQKKIWGDQSYVTFIKLLG